MLVTSTGGGHWTRSGANIYYTAGNVGINTSSPSVLLEVNDGVFQQGGGGQTYPTSANTKVMVLQGDPAAPDSNQASTAIFQKHSDYKTTGSEINACGYFQGTKRGAATSQNNRVQGIVSEAIDYAGGVFTFIEGIRSHALLSASANPSGLADAVVAVALAETGAVYKHLIGVESEIWNASSQSVTKPLDPTQFNCSFLSTLRSPYGTDVGFLMNPNNTIRALYGFYSTMADTGMFITDYVDEGLYIAGRKAGNLTSPAIKIAANSGFLRLGGDVVSTPQAGDVDYVAATGKYRGYDGVNSVWTEFGGLGADVDGGLFTDAAAPNSLTVDGGTFV